jgi:putative transposase
MQILEFKLYGTSDQYKLIDEAIRTAQFIRNKCIRAWVDEGAKPKDERQKFGPVSFNYLCAPLAKEFEFADKLNAHARHASAERAWQSVAHFYSNCRSGKPGKKGYPKFQKDNRSVEYKTSGWKLSADRKSINFKDGHKIGWLKLTGGRQIEISHLEHIKRVRIVRLADGYYAQFSINVPNEEHVAPTGKSSGIDVGLESFYTDSNGAKVENPRNLRKSEHKLKRLQRRLSKKRKGSKNKEKARKRLARKHLKVSRQRKDFAVKTARCVVKSNDFVAVEDLKVRNMVKNHRLAKSISDASWRQFRTWLEYYGRKFGRVVVAVDPAYTSQVCSACGCLPSVKKGLGDRWHACENCGFETDRDHNAALNILSRGLREHSKSTVGRTVQACGDETSLVPGSDAVGLKVLSMNQESPSL